ncbi:MAG: magnesium/cobalt transporter CorA [Promethearchaeota archaeon]
MSQFVSLFPKRKKKVGLAPGTLIYVGEKEKEVIDFYLTSFDESNIIEKTTTNLEDCLTYKKHQVHWLNINGIQDVAIIEKIGKQYGLHPLTLEDILNTFQRPKVEEYDEYLFVVLKMLFLDEENMAILPDQVSIILGKDFVLTFQEKKGDVFDPVRKRMRNEKSRIRRKGSDFLTYSLIDIIVDHYYVLLESLGEKLEEIEAELITNPSPTTLHTIYQLKRELITLRRSIWPLREVINSLSRTASPLITQGTQLYIRDVYDHTIQVIDTTETYRDVTSGMLDLYLSSVSNRMNEIMKVLTIIATIFIPLTFLAGVYGMNFEYMPELEWQFGYYGIWILMIGIAIILFIYFKKQKWI